MKKFSAKILLFIFLLVIGIFIFNHILENGLKKTRTGEFSVWNDIVQSEINSDVIVMGSSRALHHINPSVLDTILDIYSYNLGSEGNKFEMQYARYKIFKQYNKNPKLIIQNLDFSTFEQQTTIYDKTQYLPYMNEDVLQQALNGKKGFSKLNALFPITGYSSEYLTIVSGIFGYFNIKQTQTERYKGFHGTEAKWDGRVFQQIINMDSISYTKNSEIISLFDAFLNDCKNNDINVVLIFTPEYIMATEYTKNKDEFMQFCRSFSDKYNFTFLDYSQDELCYDTAYFCNATHLNKTGANIFTQKLAHDIDSLNLLKTRER